MEVKRFIWGRDERRRGEVNFKTFGCWGLAAYSLGFFAVAPLLEELVYTPNQPHNEQPDCHPPWFQQKHERRASAGMDIVIYRDR